MDSYKRREMASRLEVAAKHLPVVILTGMRQTGKTTLLQHEPATKNHTYVTMDDFAVRKAAIDSPESLLQSVKGPMVIDEVQKVPGLIESVKLVIDRERRPGRFVLSGSANLLLMSQVTESLAGRALYLALGPMSRRELAGTRERPFLVGILEDGSLPKMPGGAPFDFREVVLGGMPPVVVDGASPELWFQGFEQTYLERDIRSLATVVDLTQFQTFLRLAALRTGRILNQSELGRDAGVSTATASRYLSLLETSFSVFRLPPFLRNPSVRLVKSSKLFVSDSGLANYLIGPREGIMTAADRFAGPLLETYVAVNLRSILASWLPQTSLCYWNIQGRHEVDFVAAFGERTVAVEVKRGSRWSGKDLRGLRKFLEVTPGCVAGLLACNIDSATPIPLGERLWAVPLGAILT
jgi:uncharacterized protein